MSVYAFYKVLIIIHKSKVFGSQILTSNDYDEQVIEIESGENIPSNQEACKKSIKERKIIL